MKKCFFFVRIKWIKWLCIDYLRVNSKDTWLYWNTQKTSYDYHIHPKSYTYVLKRCIYKCTNMFLYKCLATYWFSKIALIISQSLQFLNSIEFYDQEFSVRLNARLIFFYKSFAKFNTTWKLYSFEKNH